MHTPQELEHGISRVTGRTLREALANVRLRYGGQARIVETRSVEQRADSGLGRARVIEVLVELPGPDGPRSVRLPVSAPAGLDAIAAEIARIERLVDEIAAGAEPAVEKAVAAPAIDPLDRALLAAGAERGAVRHLQRLRGSEEDRDARAHLMSRLPVSGGDWRTFAGVHVFLGGPGVGKSDLVLGAASALRGAGRRPLALAVAPRHRGEIKRLQEEAAAGGYDAAVVRDAAQFVRSLPHLGGYDAVLVDTPAWETTPLRDGELRACLSGREDLHRHVVVPLDLDLGDRESLWEEARAWNADWLALTRVDLAPRPGRLLGLLLTAPCPVSLLGRGPWPGTSLTIPDAATLVDVCTAGAEAVARGEASVSEASCAS